MSKPLWNILNVDLFFLLFSVGNKPSSSLPKPVVASSSVKVVCGTPASIHLTPLIHAPQGLPPCPAAARAGRIATQAYRNLDIGVSIRDASGREFVGVESIQLGIIPLQLELESLILKD